MTPQDPRPPLSSPVGAAGPGDRSLGECEEVIERGLATFVDVGRALAEIRDGRLYRVTHDTFEGYCQERWQFTRVRAHQLIEAAGVLTMVNSDVPITSERQARALGPVIRDLGPEAAAEILQEQAATGRVTASGITEAARRRADAYDPAITDTDDDTDPAGLVDEYIHADGDVRRARLRHDFAKWQHQIGRVSLFDVQEMASICRDDDREMAERIFNRLAEWAEAYLKATAPKPGLRLIGGDR